MVDVRINARELIISLEQNAREVSDLSEFWTWLVANRIRPAVANVFETSGYGRWPQRRDNLPHPLLRQTYRLFYSLTRQTGDSIVEITPTSLRFGTSVDYAQYHEFGTSRIPPRPFLELLIGNQSFVSMIERDLQAWLDNRFERNTRR